MKLVIGRELLHANDITAAHHNNVIKTLMAFDLPLSSLRSVGKDHRIN